MAWGLVALQVSIRQHLAELDDAFGRDHDALLAAGQLEGLDQCHVRVGFSHLFDHGDHVDVVDALVIGRRLLADEIRRSPLTSLIEEFPPASFVPDHQSTTHVNGSLPVVVTHGMGDSCFNPGMKSITKLIGDHLGVYSVCIPTGDDWVSDTCGAFGT